MTLTITEYAKGIDNPVSRAIVQLFPNSVDFLNVMPFMTASGGVWRWPSEAALPTNMAFRPINGTVAEGYGVYTDQVEQTFPMAGNINVDRVLISRHGPEARAKQERLEIKAQAVLWANTFMNGNNQTAPDEFTGLRPRLAAVGGSVDGSNYLSRILANSTASGGAALSLAQLDRAMDLVEEPNAIIMSKRLLSRFPAAERDINIGGFVSQSQDGMGKIVTRYRGIPIYTGYGVSALGDYLPFNEVAHGGGSAVTTSIYVVRFADDGVCGLQVAPMKVTDMGLIDNAVHYRTNIEYDVGMAILSPFSAIRLSSITDAPIVK